MTEMARILLRLCHNLFSSSQLFVTKFEKRRKVKRPILLAVLCIGWLPSCSQTASPPGPPPRQPVVIQKRSVDEIARMAFGSAYRDARVAKDTALFEYAPRQDGTADANYNKIFMLGAGVVPATFRDEKSVQTIRLTAVDPDQPTRRLAVWSISRKASATVPWQHLPPVAELKRYIKVEYSLPQ